jgi:hypothetical protein
MVLKAAVNAVSSYIRFGSDLLTAADGGAKAANWRACPYCGHGWTTTQPVSTWHGYCR